MAASLRPRVRSQLVAWLGCAFLAPLPLIAAEPAGDGGGNPPVAVPDDVTAQAILSEARALWNAGRLQDARDALDRARAMAAGDVVLQARIEGLAGEWDGHPGPVQADAIRSQLAQVEVQQYLRNLRSAIERGDWMRAERYLEGAQATANRYPAAIDEEERRLLASLAESVAEGRELSEEDAASEERRQTQRRALEKAALYQAEQRSLKDERIARIIGLKQRQHYELALEQVRQLAAEHSGDERIEALYEELLTLTHQQRRLDWEEQRRELKEEVSDRVNRTLIPTGYDGWPDFPEDWRTRSQLRDQPYAAVEMAAWEESLRNELAQRISLTFEEVGLAEALEFVANRTGLNIIPAPEVLADVDSTVSLIARDMRIDNVLDWIVRQGNTTWTLDNGAVYVGPDLEREVVTLPYDVAHLLYVPPDFPGIQIGLSDGAEAGGGGFSFLDNESIERQGYAPEDMVDLIQQTVDPLVWDRADVGVRLRGTTLLITAPPSTHRVVREFLRTMSNIDDLLIQVDTRWLELYDHYAQEIGLDWRNSGIFGQNQNNGEIGIGGGDGFYRSVSDSVINGAMTGTLPASGSGLAQQIVGSGLQLQFAYLGVTQLAALFKAVEVRQRGRVLDGVSITMRNGTRANAFHGSSYAYISDYEVGAGTDGGGLFDPVISVLNTGTNLDVAAFVTADRKYVTLELRPSVTTFTSEIASVVGLATFDAGGGGGGVGNVDFVLLVPLEFPLELPTVFLRQVRTRVLVPDRGSVLVSGFKDTLTEHLRTQIPFLGTFPFLGRLFGTRGVVKSQTDVYFSAKVKIINYPELEAGL